MATTIGKFMQPKSHSDEVDPNKITPPPVLTSPAPIHPVYYPPPPLTTPATIQFQTAPPLTSPHDPPFMPAPPLSVTASLPFQPAPPLSIPAVLPPMPAPPLSTPAVLPAMPAPPLSVKAILPEMPVPVLRVTASLPFQPPPVLSATASLPFQPPPTLTNPADLQRADQLAGRALPGDETCRAMVNDKIPHAELVREAESAHHIAPGIAGLMTGVKSDVAGILTNINMQSRIGVAVPGVGVTPVDITFNTHGGKLNAGVDLHVRETARAAANVAIEYGKAKLQAIAQQGITKLEALTKGALQSPVDVPMEFTSDKPPLTSVSSFAEMESQAKLPALPGTPSPAPTIIPDLIVTPRDDKMTYAADSRELAQGNQQFAASMADQAALSNKHTPGGTLTDLFQTGAQGFEQNLARSFFGTKRGVIPVGFKSVGGKSETRGYFPVDASNASTRNNSVPSDDEAYVPLVFTDLRPTTGRVYRSVYFRPYIKSLSENFAPDWSMSSYFGRVDPVATYQGTNRTVSLSFKLVPMTFEDLQTMYQKLGWLTSMVYPQYRDNVYYRGPVVRMRVGDVINAKGKEGNRGLPGVITSLDISYDDTTWELVEDHKLPRYIDISLGFHVLHEYPVGLVRGVGGDNDTAFGGIYPGGGPTGNKGDSYVNINRFRDSFGGDYLNDPKMTFQPNPDAGKSMDVPIGEDK
jgi:hypothetical protein